MNNLDDRFKIAYERSEQLKARIKAEWQMAQRVILMMVVEKQYEKARGYRTAVMINMDIMRTELYQVLMSMPPFVIVKDDKLEQQPVDEAGIAILREAMGI